jgi:hypothetical protein
MSIQNQIATINGSMNYDNTGKYVRTEQGQVIQRTNLRINSKDGQKYYNEKIKGNLLIQTALPTGTNKTIGWCDDYKSNAIVYFVHNSNNNHCIMRYFINTKTIEKVWYAESTLEFEDTFLQAWVADGTVYWVNGEQQPKSVHLQRAANFMKVLYNAQTIDLSERYSVSDKPYDINIFKLIKIPPQFAPTVSYGQDTEYNFNNLRKKLFQFKYAYVYKDNQVSAWSPISKVPLPINELTSEGEFIDDITMNNVIEILYNSGCNDVKSILFAARDTFSRNTSSFWQFDIIEKYDTNTGDRLLGEDGFTLIPDDSGLVISFYNNKYTTSINTNVNNRYCDHVPLSGNDIILFDSKYLGIAYPKQGYDGLVTDYSLTAVTQSIETKEELRILDTMSVDRLTKIFSCGASIRDFRLTWIDIPKTLYPNSYYNITFTIPVVLEDVSFTVETGSSGSFNHRDVRDNFLTQIRAYFITNYPDWSYYIEDKSSSSPRGIVLGFFPTTEGCPNYQAPINLKGNVTTSLADVIPTAYKSLKKGQFHPFALIYNDGEGRYNIVFGDEEMYSPIPTNNTEAELKKKVLCQWSINHKPPEYAKSYRWAYIRNKSYTYARYFSYVKSTQGTINNGIPNEKYFLEVNQSYQRIRDRLPNYLIPDYVWQNGDRIRVVGQSVSYEVLQEYTWIADDQAESGLLGIMVDSALTTHVPDLGNNVGYIPLLEIYRPNPTPQDNVYCEIGEEFPIRTDSYGNKYHSVVSNSNVTPANHIDQVFNSSGVLVTPASGIMDFGDVYLRQRAVIDNDFNILLPVIEDEYFNDYYISDAIDVGREGAKIKAEQKHLNRVQRSENFLENTEYNLLNVWLPSPLADYFDASDIYGNITGIQEAGDVLKVVQTHMETSCYIGKILAKEADGNDMFLESDRVFGTKRQYTEIRGSNYVNSIISNKRNLFYFDDSTGELIRSAPNGQIPISSEYHMGNYFEKKAKELREYSGHKDVIISCDNDYQDVMISFIKGNEIETIIFYEREGEKGFTHFAQYKTNSKIPEMFAFQGDTHISFLEGKLYLSNNGVNNTFYGQLQPCSVKFAVNIQPISSKRYSNIWINSNKNIWDVEFTSEDMVNYGLQKSILKPTVIEELNGRLHASILKNMIDRDGTEDIQLLYDGHDLVGEIMFVELSNNDSSDVTLGEVEVKYYLNK